MTPAPDAAAPSAPGLAGEVLELARQAVDVRALWEQFTRPVGTLGIFYWQNLFIYAVGGLLFYHLAHRRRAPGAPTGLGSSLRYLLPEGWRTPAFRLDVIFFFIDLLGVRTLVNIALSLLLAVPVVTRGLRALQLWTWPGLSSVSAWAAHLGPAGQGTLAFALSVLGGEFAFYWYHRTAHRVPLLWQFHKVHHYSQEMNPLVALRVHPLDAFFQVEATFIGSLLFLGLVFPVGPGDAVLVDANGIPSGENLTWVPVLYQIGHGIAVRFTHTPIPIRFGFGLDRIWNSPVVHQVHHSREIFDTNFGNTLSVWDTVFGTFHLPPPGEAVKFGITEFGDEHYQGLLQALAEPFRDAYRLLRSGGAFRRPRPQVQPQPGL